ncbi:MAG: PBSX family phage terminase large subunit [Fusobacteriaceae bacterium]
MKKPLKFNKHFGILHETWDFKILLAIGSYGSGKSHEMFTKVAMKAHLEKRKIMVVRKEFTTLKESCYSDIEDAFDRLGVWNNFKFTTSPLQIKGKNGTRIIFRGLDKVRKIKSIKDIDLIIVEEADEISLEELKELINRLRTARVKTHIIFLCNPVSRGSSIYKYFFEELEFEEEELYEKQLLIKEIELVHQETKSKEIMKIIIHHSTYKNNRFLTPDFVHNLENEKDPRIKRIACEGKFGADGDLVLHNAVFEKGVYERYVEGKLYKENQYRGLDWGHSTSYTVGLKMAVNETLNELYIYWEFYDRRLSTDELILGLETMREGRVTIMADTQSQTNYDFMKDGYKILGVDKKNYPIEYGEQMLRSFSRIVIDVDRCPNTKREVEECVYKKNKYGEAVAGNYNIDPHSVDCMRYALQLRKWKPLKKRRQEER